MAKQGDSVNLLPIHPKKQRRKRGWFDNLEKAEKLVHEAALALHKLDPQHKLLCLWFVRRGERVGVNEEAEKQRQIEMRNRFWTRIGPWEDEADPIKVCLVVLNNYRLALKKAIKEIIEEINWKEQILPGLEIQKKIQKQRQKQWQKRQKRSVPLLEENAA